MRAAIFAAGLAAAALFGAPRAHADAQGYIAQLQRDGVSMLSGTIGPKIIDAAHLNLCPDTLH